MDILSALFYTHLAVCVAMEYRTNKQRQKEGKKINRDPGFWGGVTVGPLLALVEYKILGIFF